MVADWGENSRPYTRSRRNRHSDQNERRNFRLLTRLLTQIERILKVNQTEVVSKEIVTAARDSLVIGQS
jgi:hypothetical protein